MSEDIDTQSEPKFGDAGYVIWTAEQREIPLDNPHLVAALDAEQRRDALFGLEVDPANIPRDRTNVIRIAMTAYDTLIQAQLALAQSDIGDNSRLNRAASGSSFIM